MTEDKKFHYQIHGYQSGHQLLSGSVDLMRTDQDTIDRLSDISGQIRPGEKFESYLTCYPLPSEKYFVLARTWQDLTAPRAGCVVTKSILVPVNTWSRLEQIDLIFSELIIPPKDLRLSIAKSPIVDDSESLREAPIDELVECLFLEKRQPVLVFDSTAQDLIVKKLYAALWPGIRRTFACCTFALGPRSIGGRRFDLLFTKSDLRGRFSDWTGRRVQGGIGLKKDSRHRWTHEIAVRIFYSTRPSLTNEQFLPFFDQDDPDAENGLRLSLLWNELTAKAGSSPIAVLGLLDIINSRAELSDNLYRSVRPLILHVIKNASSTLGILEAWRFYAALLSKHRNKPIGRDLFLQVKESCTLLAMKSPEEAVYFVSSWDLTREKLPSMIFASVGDGISDRLLNSDWPMANALPVNVSVQLVSASKKLAKSIMTLCASEVNGIAHSLITQITTADRSTSKRARNNLALFLDDLAHIWALSALFEAADLGDYQRIVKAVGENTGFRLREFDNEILRYTAERSQFRYLLEELIEYNEAGSGSALVAKLLFMAPELIGHFVNSNGIGVYETQAVLRAVLLEANSNVVESIASDPKLSSEIFHSFCADEIVNQRVILTIAIRSGLLANDIIRNTSSLTLLNEVESKHLEVYLLTQLRGENVNELHFLGSLISQLEIKNAKILVNRLFLNRTIGLDTVKVFNLFVDAGPTFHVLLVADIDAVSDILAKSLVKRYDGNVINSWLSLFYLAVDTEKRKKAAVCIMDFSFKSARYDPTDLLIAAFPVVYNAYLNSQPITHYFSFIFFSDWDKCKTLRNDLVRRYMQSSWSHFGLFRIAAKTDILDEVFSIVKENRGGRKYIEVAIQQAKIECSFDGQGVKEFRKFIEKHNT